MEFLDNTLRLRLWLAALLLLSLHTAFAQQLTLRSFGTDEMDLSARTYERLDVNGERCALIKVQLPIEGCVFEGAKVGDVEYKVNEYWLYVPSYTKRINIKCPGLEASMIIWEKRIGLHGVTGGNTYILRLDGYSAATRTPAKEGNYMVFTLTPADASVRIDGSQQAAPRGGKLSVFLRKGSHTYEASAPGYATEAGSFDMEVEKQSLAVSLTSTMARLTIDCETAGAAFYINDECVANGRWTGQLPAGSYRVEARKDGYRTQVREISLAENAGETVQFPALEAVLGLLDVDYDPVDAEVWLDGNRLGESPGIWDVNVGDHKVELRCQGYAAASSTVSISEGQTVKLTGSLKPLLSAGESATSGITSSEEGTINGYEYVDLGLSVKWAACNVGADTPAEYGDYFAWGEISTKYAYYTTNSQTWGKSMGDISGDPEHDAARANMGGSWRLPTRAECRELIAGCRIESASLDGVNGFRFTSKKNGNSIFLPAAGWYGGRVSDDGKNGMYWTSEPHPSSKDSSSLLWLSPNERKTNFYNRENGRSVRAVSE